MSLEHLVNLFWANVAVVVQRVKALGEGLLTVGAKVALMSVRHLAVLMNFTVTTEPTFHSLSRGLECLYFTKPTSF